MEKENILLKLKSNLLYIKELSEVDEELKLFIVKDNGNNIKYIKNLSKEV